MGDKGEETKEEEKGQKFAKDGDDSLWNGPVKKRSCTDIVCVPLFIGHIVLFWILTFANAGTGDPMKLIKPRDYQGQFCGIGADGQWNSNADLTNFPKQMWSMNIDAVFDPVAQSLVCGNEAYSILPAGNVKTNFGKYCGKADNSLQDIMNAGTQLQNDVSAQVESYKDPAKAYQLFQSSSKVGSGLMKEITKNLNEVCTTSCSMDQNSVSQVRTYTYSPAPMTLWGSDPAYRAIDLWNAFKAEPGAANIMNQFTFAAWDKSQCPYEDKYCVPTPGLAFDEISDWNQCYPKMDTGIVGAATGQITAQASAGLESLAKLSVTEDLQKGFGDGIADALKTWQVFIIVCVLSLVLGIICLVLLRFIICPMVWGSIILIFLCFVAGGLALIVRSGQCLDASFEDAAKSASDTWTANAVNATNPFSGVECPGGWAIEGQDARDWTKIAGYVVLGFAALWLVIVLCMTCRIQLAIAINKAACEFMYTNPQVCLVPVFQNLIGLVWIILWIWCASFLLSQVPTDNVPTKAFATYAEAYGTADTAGACTDTWPSGAVYVDENILSNPLCAGASPLCYKCSAPRFIMDWKFGYSFFAFLWHNFFVAALGQCTIAGAVGIWFFTPKDSKFGRATVLVSFKNAMLFHVGSLAFGSLILAIVVWLKWFMTWLSKQAKASKNKVMEVVCKILAYCLWCFEKCVKFLNKNAYIQIALMGTPFCKSAKNAFFLILRNIARFGIICALSHLVHFVGMVMITAATAVVGYFILTAMYEDVNPIIPVITYVFVGWITAKLFIGGCFGLAVDATLQCFIAAEEMDAGNDFAPKDLKAFIDSKSEEKDKMCDGCCCTIM